MYYADDRIIGRYELGKHGYILRGHQSGDKPGTGAGWHSAKILLYSVDFSEFNACLENGDWEKIAGLLSAAAKNLENAGADFILICTNTMHKVAPIIQSSIRIPIIHIAEATAEKLLEQGIKKAALLGTKYTMQQDFFKEKLLARGIEVLIPDEADMTRINDIIFSELCLGIVSASSRAFFLDVIGNSQIKAPKASSSAARKSAC